jgi:hypothetical protein
VSGLVNLYGIESPGLTASMPLADEVVRQLAFIAAERPVCETSGVGGFSATRPALSLN